MTLSPDLLTLILPALAAGLLVAATHVPLGRDVLKRGIIFLDLAVAQIAALGAVIATSLLHWPPLGQQALAFICALIAAGIFARLEKAAPVLQEAFIGCTFVVAASLAILIFAGDPHGGEEISNLMAGQILWARWPDIARVAVIYVPICALLLCKPQFAQRYFYILFTACVTLSVQLVGVYLVFASLILPALAAHGLSIRRGLIAGYVTAVLAVAGGLITSILTDYPSGPLIVCGYVVAAVVIRCAVSRHKHAWPGAIPEN